MNATELMIGDWVFTRGEKIQVTQLYDGYICTEHHKDSHDYYFNPIPLTPKILKNNGWEIIDVPATQGKPIGKIKVKRQGDLDYEIQYRIGHYFRLDAFLRKELMKPNEVYTFFPPVTIIIDHNWGVHELQHALRLLGFSDVADNFKI